MKNIYVYSLIVLSCLFITCETKAQNNFFTDVNESSVQTAGQQRVIIPEKYRTVLLDTSALANFLRSIPTQKNIQDRNNLPVIEIPLPNGKTGRFHIWETSIMEPALAAKFPNIKTYSGQGIDDPVATIKIDWTDLGFHAMILSTVTGHVFIDPYSQGNKTTYIAYFKSDFKEEQRFMEQSLPDRNKISSRPLGVLSTTCVGSQLLTYRLAIACTDQYAIAATGLPSPTVAQTLMAIVTTIQRVTGIYETELSISLVLVGNEDTIIFTNAATDQLHGNNSNISGLITQGQTLIDQNIGDPNYDVGEIFSTGPGGGSYVGVVCKTQQKSGSAVGVQHPVGDPFNVDYVAHEIGHEFGAHHPFNSNTDFCGAAGQDYPGTNDEPGSGSTIMGYAGSATVNGVLCGSDNLQAGSDPEFNGINFSEIINFVNTDVDCGAITATTNHPPVVNAGTDYTIPVRTPFVLTGSATDQDNDPLTYSWEQMNTGPGHFGPWNQPKDSAPIFRSFPPVTSPSRYFPKLSDVINNTVTIGEILPTYSRILRFRLTVRDNRSGNGGVCYAENAVTVDESSGPFIVTYPDTANIVWNVNDIKTVTWNPAGTQSAPVSCANVMIQLSTDGGLTYPDTLVASVPNTGSANVKVPDSITTKARIRVVAIGNVFYDISNNDFTIQKGAVTSSTANWIIYMGTGEVNVLNNINDADVQEDLFDASGRLMLTKNIGNVIPGQTNSISLNSFARGVYILKIFSASHGTFHKEIIVR